MQKPLIGMVCDRRAIGQFPLHTVDDGYIDALSSIGDVLLIPALGQDALARLLPLFDGIVLTGAASNIEPARYGEGPSREGTLHDRMRDATTLPLIKLALSQGAPILGICRGFQEINVALGGTLHQHLQELPDKMDHREKEGDLATEFADAHPVRLLSGSLMAQWLGKDETIVNSLHQQGVNALAPGLVAEALAPDGQIEAFRLEGESFLYAVQWHPEWRFAEKEASKALFGAFQAACVAYRQHKNRPA